ncbi:unnamed protein product [Lymnaea stagnalis]|uniref:Uncharacterized protein n=1 Tax=Lymnaea stagnalis TaxID=6523 RepID=A0AAV2HD59_LYMST
MFGGSQTNVLALTPGILPGSQNFPSSSPTDSRVPMTPNINRHNISIDQYVPSTPASQTRHHHVPTPLTPEITTPTPRPLISCGTSPINILTHLQSSTLVPCVVQNNTSDQLVPTTPEGCIQISQNDGDKEQPMVPTKDMPPSKINSDPVERNKTQVKGSTKKICSSRRRLSLDKTCEKPPQNSPPICVSSDNSATSENNNPASDQEFLPSLLTRQSTIEGFPPSSNHLPSLGAYPQSYTQTSPIHNRSLSPHQGTLNHGQNIKTTTVGHPSSRGYELHEAGPVPHPSSASFAPHETRPLGYSLSTVTSSHSRDEVTLARRQAQFGTCLVHSPSRHHVVPCQSAPKIDLFSGDDIFFC